MQIKKTHEVKGRESRDNEKKNKTDTCPFIKKKLFNFRDEKRVPLKHWTSGFCRIPQVVEPLERNSESTGTKAQSLHTFPKTTHCLSSKLQVVKQRFVSIRRRFFTCSKYRAKTE